MNVLINGKKGRMKMAKKNKKLTLGVLKEQDEQLYKQKEINVKGYKVMIDTKFRKTKLQKLINELVQALDYIKENKYQIDILTYLYILLIKYFTDIPVPNELEKQIIMTNLLIDNGYFEAIVNEFDQNEINKFIEMLNVYKNNLFKILESQDLGNLNKEDVNNG
jgi:hypothetical protein